MAIQCGCADTAEGWGCICGPSMPSFTPGSSILMLNMEAQI